MLKRLIAAAFFALAAPAVAAPAAEPLEVLPNGLPVGLVSVDGEGPYRFIIDTAASNTNFLPAFEASRPGRPLARVKREISGAAGKSTVEVVPIRRLSVAGRTHEGLEGFVLPPSPIDALGVQGILGADVLTRHVLDIDAPRRRWALAAASPQNEAAMFEPVPFELDEALAPRLTVVLDGVEIPAVLDTGARGAILNLAAARKLGLEPGDPRLTARRAAQGATAGSTPLSQAALATLRVGAFERKSPVVIVADLPVFEVLGLSGGPGMILGMDQLGDRRFILDFPNKRLLIER